MMDICQPNNHVVEAQDDNKSTLVQAPVIEEAPQVQVHAEMTGTEPMSITTTQTHHAKPGEKRKRGRPRREGSDATVGTVSVAATEVATIEQSGAMVEAKNIVEEAKIPYASPLHTLPPTQTPQTQSQTQTSLEDLPSTTTIAGGGTTPTTITTPAAATKKATPSTKKSRDTYYCKHCDTNFPVGFFRNVQQFGAHCSNCSRGRSLQTPDDTYASRLPTRLQRALKRKKRQEEGGGLPRKRGRKAKKEKAAQAARVPRERRKPKIPPQYGEDLEESVGMRAKRRDRKAAQYNAAYIYDFNRKCQHSFSFIFRLARNPNP